MKQLSKRVSAALPAVLMGLSLLPQTVLALDPDQRQAERREGYDVATVHYTDAKGDEQAIPFTETGSGYVYTLPQGVTEDKATVEYFSTTRRDGAVDISWYNDIDKEFTLTTARQLSGLSQTGAVGYQYWKKDTENLVAATKYVTLETLLKAAGADFTPGMTVSAADATGFASTLSYQDYQTCRWYIDGSGVKSDAPAALALCWNSGEGAVEQVAAGAVDTGSIRFCYGISEDQYGSAAGKRLVSGVVTVTVQTCVHDGESQDVPGTPATCTQPGVTAGVKCTDCGVIVSGCTEIPAVGHTPELRDAKDAGCTQDGYTGDTYCSVCGQLLTRGQVIPAKGHDYQDGKCTVCGAENPDYQPEQPTQPENPGVKTGDESYVVLWSAALLLGGAALVLLPRKKRS